MIRLLTRRLLDRLELEAHYEFDLRKKVRVPMRNGAELVTDDIVSVEPMGTPEMPAEMKGIDAIQQKNQWWTENHEVHDASVAGPWPHGEEKFAVRFTYDVNGLLEVEAVVEKTLTLHCPTSWTDDEATEMLLDAALDRDGSDWVPAVLDRVG